MRALITSAIFVALGSTNAAGQTPADCAESLQGLMTTEKLFEQEDGKVSFRRFECASSFRSGQDLVSYGFKLPLTYQGVTVTPEFEFDQTNVEQWKQANCSAGERAASVAREVGIMRTFFPDAGMEGT